MTFPRSLCLAGVLSLLAACGGDRPGQDPASGARADGAPTADSAPAAAPVPVPAPVPAFVAEEAAAAGEATASDSTAGIRSVYTSLAESACRLVKEDVETGATTSRCPGAAGYALLVHDFDARMTVDVVAPNGRTHRLRYSGVITSAFSSLGPRAEWRMQDGDPVALIIRVNAFEDPAAPTRATSYLAVARVGDGQTCVTDRIPPSADANEAARRAADGAASRPCMRDLAEQR